jgi:tRNA(Ile)-lysidine synthetase-like protein
VVRANGSYPLCPGFKSLHRHHPLLKRFRRELKATPIQEGQRVLVAVSGGGDSVGLLALLLSARPRPNLTLGVAHVHHNLRGAEADRDEAAVRALAEALGLPFLHARLRGKPSAGGSVEAWARDGRYAALERLRAKGRWDWIATAHSLDDQAETVLMRIARGTGLEGLAAIRQSAGAVVRPALAFSGAELREAARTCGLRFLEDSTNRDRRFLRNRVRLEIMPAIEADLPGFSRRLAALARLAAEAASRRCPEVAVPQGDTLYYSCEVLSQISEAEALGAFRNGLRSLMGHLKRIGEAHLRALWTLRMAKPGGRVDLPGEWEGVREKEGIRLKRHSRPARKERP